MHLCDRVPALAYKRVARSKMKYCGDGKYRGNMKEKANCDDNKSQADREAE